MPTMPMPPSAPAAAAPATAPIAPAAPAAPRALVLVTGDDVYEDIFTAALELQALLVDVGFVARVAMGAGRLVSEHVENDEELIVLYTAAGWFGAAAQQALLQRVEAGAGLVALHSANVLPDDAVLAELIGSRYRSHGPRPHESRYRVEPDGSHALTRGIAPFEITHEHYVLDLRAPVRTVAWRETEHGREPLVHVQKRGEGRVCYIQFGHDMRSWGEPGVREIVRRAARWAAPGGAS